MNRDEAMEWFCDIVWDALQRPDPLEDDDTSEAA